MDPRYTPEILRHLEKQEELLMNAYGPMLNELQRLQVEEEMLMRKFFQLMEAQGLAKKNGDDKTNNVPDEGNNGALVTVSSNEQ